LSVESYILEEMKERKTALYNQLRRLVYRKNRIGAGAFSSALDLLRERGDLLKLSHKGCTAYYLPDNEEKAWFLIDLYERYSATINDVAVFGEKLIAVAVERISLEKSLDYEVMDTRVSSYEVKLLGSGRQRRQIDVLVKAQKRSFYLNIESKNRMKPVTKKEMNNSILNSEIAKSVWFNGCEVRTALVCSFIGGTAREELKGMDIPVAITQKVFLPSGKHENLYKEYIENFGYHDIMSIVDEDKIPEILIQHIDKYILRYFG